MSKLIGTFLTNIIPPEHSWKIKLFGYWETIIGNMKDKVRIEKINNTSLILGVCHPTWANELFFLAPMIKKKINKLLQEEKIQKIQFKIVEFKESQKNTTKTAKKTNPKTPEHCLSITEHTNLESIPNLELRNVIEQFYIRCKKTNPKKGT